MFFRGVNSVQLDDKSRMAIPTRYRKDLHTDNSGQMVVTIDTESTCLLLYPLSEWEEIEKKIEALPSFNVVARRIQRLLIGHATDVEMDSHGRILLSTPLREYADLQKSVMLVGQGKKFEIWNEANWYKARDVWLEQGIHNQGPWPTELEALSL